MATVTLKEKAKKLIKDITSSAEDERILFHQDEYLLEQWERKTSEALLIGNFAIQAFNKFYKVDTADEFFNGLLKDEVEFYKFKHKLFFQEEFDRFARIGTELTIMIPEGFDEVRRMVKKAKNLFTTQRPDFFELSKDGLLTLTTAYYNRRNSKCYLYADGEEEIERLNYCNSVIREIEKIEPILLRNKKLSAAVESKRYALPLPYFLKIINTKNGKKLIPNPTFIKEGFAGTHHLGIYLHTKIERKIAQKAAIPKLGEKYKMVEIIDVSGMPTGKKVLCLEKDLHKHAMGPFRVHKNIVRDGYYNEDGAPWGTPLKPRQVNATSSADRFVSNYK